MKRTLTKKDRVLELFYRLMKGEHISIKKTAEEYGVSTKSISRDIGNISNLLAESMETSGNVELEYCFRNKCYYMKADARLESRELVTLIKILIGTRALNELELMGIIAKLKRFTTYNDRQMIEQLISNESYHYKEVKRDCASVMEHVWKLSNYIARRKEITITYYKSSRVEVERRIRPLAITFSEYYFYLIAYRCDKEDTVPLYYRADRIINIVEHRKEFQLGKEYYFDEGELRQNIHLMFPGKYRNIRFEYSGPSVQAILDKIPTAKIVSIEGNIYTLEARCYGTGINMVLLSQGSWVKVVSPPELVQEIKEEVEKIRGMYE